MYPRNRLYFNFNNNTTGQCPGVCPSHRDNDGTVARGVSGYVAFGTWQFRYKGVDTFGTWRLRYIWDPFRYMCFFAVRLRYMRSTISVHHYVDIGTLQENVNFLCWQSKKCPVDVSLFIVCFGIWRFGVIYARKFAKNAEIYSGWRMKTPKIKTLAYTYAIKWSPDVQTQSLHCTVTIHHSHQSSLCIGFKRSI